MSWQISEYYERLGSPKRFLCDERPAQWEFELKLARCLHFLVTNGGSSINQHEFVGQLGLRAAQSRGQRDSGFAPCSDKSEKLENATLLSTVLNMEKIITG